MNFFNWKETRWGAYTFAVCSGVLLYVILEHLGLVGAIFFQFFSFIEPVIIGVCLAYVMDCLARFYEQKLFLQIKKESRRRMVAVVLTIISVLAILTLVLFSLIPQLISSIQEFALNINSYGYTLQKLIGNINFKFGNWQLNADNFTSTLTSSISTITKQLSSNMGSIFEILKNIGSGGTNALIAFIISLYCLTDKKNLLDAFYKLFHSLMPERIFRNCFRFYEKTNVILSKYIACTLLDALFVGAANAIFMFLLGMPYISMVSIVVGFTNMAPTFGPFVGAAIGAFILLLSKPWYAVAFLLFTLVIQIIDGYVIKPKFYGNALSVPSVWILIAIVVFGRMFGVVGILLAIPFAAMIAYLLDDLLKMIEKQKGKKENNPKE